LSGECITGNLFRRMIAGATEVLKQNKATVDALNVFPVPDGDTGTNMSLTMLSATAEAQKSRSENLSAVAEQVALGSLMGARGNSGVILSQLFRGIAKGLSGHEKASAEVLAEAFEQGVETAYKAVMKPVEGTILTVAREASRAARTAEQMGKDVYAVWEAACREAEAALARTPEQLPVLKQAKVVDAGGKGLVYILKGALDVLRDQSPVKKTNVVLRPVAEEATITDDMGEIAYPYDTQLLVKATSVDVDSLREQLEPLGDSLLVVGSEEVARVHIHTERPDEVLRICLAHGFVSRVTVDNMREQYLEMKEGASTSHEQQPSRDDAEEKEVGVVAVVSGQGLIEVVKSLGADMIIDGGQTMNPSTEDVVTAVNSVKAKRVIFLPNNGNIFLAAKQAKRICDKRMYVVPTRTIPQGISALLALHLDANMETNLKRMAKAVKQVKTGEITFAVRKSQYNGFAISEGDVLGLIDGEIALTGSDASSVLNDLLDKMVDEDDEVITVFYGNGLDEESVWNATSDLSSRFPNCEIEIRNGGQPLYYYIVSVE